MEWTKEQFLKMHYSDMSNEDFARFVRRYIKEVANNSNVSIGYLSDDQILSIADRLMRLINNSGENLARITEKTNRYIREVIIRPDEESFASMPYGQRKIDISFADDKKSTYLLDVDNGDVFLRDTTKIKNPNFGVDTYKVSTYCLSEKELLAKVLYPKLNREPVDEDKIENAIVCDRFDPVDNKTFNSYLANKINNHKNNLEALKPVKTAEEMKLIEKYYGEYVPVPHFHFGTESYLINNRGGQLAITLKNLSDYLADLAEEYHRYKCGDKDDITLLNHDIGIPFYKIITKEMTFNVGEFTDKVKNILYRLSRSVHGANSAYIKDFYSVLKYMSSEKPEHSIFALADIMEFVDVIASEISPKDQVKIINAVESCCTLENNMKLSQDNNIETPLD